MSSSDRQPKYRQEIQQVSAFPVQIYVVSLGPVVVSPSSGILCFSWVLGRLL